MDEPAVRAAWPTRFGAWLIDVLLLGAMVGVVGELLGLGPGLATGTTPLDLARLGGLSFVYWTLFEWNTGQSLGKFALGLQVVDEHGRTPSPFAAAIESFGKAFLLPLDVLVGVVAMPGQGLRLFNRLSRTRVVELNREEPRSRGPSAVEA